MQNKVLGISLALTGLLCSTAWAQNVPVIDSNQQEQGTSAVNDPLAGRESLPPEQRLRLLEQQVSNLVQMNLPAKLDGLQQQLQQLNGQLEVQSHDIQALSDQVKNTGQNSEKNAVGKTSSATIAAASQPITTTVSPVSNQAVPATTSTTDKSATAVNDPADKIALAQTSLTKNTPLTSTAASTSSAPISPENEKKIYDAALDTLSKKHNDQAIAGFNSLIKAYPKGSYAPNAHYWLGELYNMKGKKDLAAKEYNVVIKQFPHSSKVPDSLLKIAALHMDMDKTSQALGELQVLIHQYPHSSAAQEANVQLQALKVPSRAEADPE